MGKGLESPKTGPIDEEPQAVKDVIASLLTAIKNYAIYPENHAICQKSIANVVARLDGFLKSHEALKLDVEKDRLLFGNEVVHHGPPMEENLAFRLFRDGIQWLEFQKGVEPMQIGGLLKILNRYRDLQEEAEGDLVTALWEADFPNLRYRAVDSNLESQPLRDLSLLNAGEMDRQTIDQKEEEPESVVSLALQSDEHPLWTVTANDIGELNRLILEEENRDYAQDLLDVVLVLFDDQREKQDLEAVLEFLEHEFQEMLAQGEFRFALNLLRGLHGVRQTYETEQTWILSILDHFFGRISSPQVLGVLFRIWPTLDILDTDGMSLLRQVLLLLPPKAILALGPMLPQIPSLGIQHQLMEIIGIMAKRDLRPLEKLLDSRDESMVQRLLHVVGYLEGERPTQILLNMVDHSSARLRKAALKHLLTRDPLMLERVFPSIEDPSEAIRHLMLEELGQFRSELAEGLLLDYLEQRRFKLTTHRHILACYRALGRCGSSRSIPFLRGVLFKRCWIPDFGRSPHRLGAAIALMALGTEDAKEILQKASQSLFPSVRLAGRKALEARR